MRIDQRDRILSALSESEAVGFQVAQEIVGQILASAYTDHTKKTYLSWLRGQIREGFPHSSILRLFRVSDEAYGRLKREKSQRIQERLRNKTLISFNGHKEVIDRLLRAEFLSLQILGLLLASGRRYAELDLANFQSLEREEDKKNGDNLLFTGQLKTKRPVNYMIPLLCERKLFLERLKGLNTQTRESFRAITWRLAHKLFGHSVHGLRARYCSLVLFREGYLKSSSLKDPFVRAKELLGHEWESDATFSYQDFAIRQGSLKEEEQILAKINGIEFLEKLKSFQNLENLSPLTKKRVSPSLVLEAIWVDINQEKIILDRLNWASVLYRSYKQRTGNTLRFPDLKRFLDKQWF
jgi:hypothetical protein